MKINQYEFLRDGKPFEPTKEEIIQFAEHELAEKDKQIATYKEVLETYKKKPVNIYQVEIRNLQVDKAELKLELEEKNKQLAEKDKQSKQISDIYEDILSQCLFALSEEFNDEWLVTIPESKLEKIFFEHRTGGNDV